ncbi:MAG: hypothetical protein KJZ65_08015 [Phycisphaerales bacterium]|nr:hypothetical protein [Phycisphaerales bacterium]
MTRLAAILLLTATALPVRGDDWSRVWPDPIGDAVFRRTDAGNDGLLPPGDPIDLVTVEVNSWSSPTPTTDPYSGSPVSNGHLLRLRLEFDGLVSPPGPLGVGQAGGNYDPFLFGPRPVYGFIEFDVDKDKDSGGELWSVAQGRFLASVARFGTTPAGSISERVAVWRNHINSNFNSGPQFERSGAEFAFTLCGCWVPTIISQSGVANDTFEVGETWILRGRFFERAISFSSLSAFWGGSDFGLFDPLVDVRWRHDALLDRTIVELVFPLTMQGAALLAGQPVQEADNSLLNHTSMQEALVDLADNATFATGNLRTLWHEWENQNPFDFLAPGEWRVTALIGTAYTGPEADARYVWTDIGFGLTPGDVNGDGLAGSGDRTQVDAFISQYDGGTWDCDGIVDGRVTLCDFANNFCLYDFNYDGVIDACDASTLGHGADLNHDGMLNFFDVAAFLQDFSAQSTSADWNSDGMLNFFDVSAYLQVFSAGCP